MQIDIPASIVEDLQELLKILNDVAEAHENLHDLEEVIETWTPSSEGNHVYPEISCPNFNVGLLRKAQKIKKVLRM